MFSTVHAWLNLKKNEKGITLGKIEKALSIKYPELTMSDTKLSKIFKDPKSKISMEELFALVDCMDLDRQEILAIIGEQEYRAAQAVDYKGTETLIAEFERREKEIRADHSIQLAKATAIHEGLQHAFESAQDAFRLAVETISRHRDEELAEQKRIHAEAALRLQDELAAKQQALMEEKKSSSHIRTSLNWWRSAAIIGYAILSAAFVYVLWELINLDKGATAILIQMVKDGYL